MKKIAAILMVFMMVLSCKESNEFKVVFSADEFEKGTEVLVRKYLESNRLAVIDTLWVNEGTFTYEGAIEIPETHYFFVGDIVMTSLPVIIEPGTIYVTLYKDSINASTVKGTRHNEEFRGLSADMEVLRNKNINIRRRAFEANQKKDTVAIKGLEAEYAKLAQEAVQLQLNFARAHPGSYVTAIILKQLLTINPEDVNPEEMQSMYNALPEKIRATKEARDAAMQLYEMNKTPVGALIPGFSGPAPEGNTLSLKNVKDKEKHAEL